MAVATSREEIIRHGLTSEQRVEFGFAIPGADDLHVAASEGR